MTKEQQHNWTGLEIAITGMSARFPGAKNTGEFWKNLVNGVESVRYFSEEELTASGISAEKFNNDSYVKAKGIIDGAEFFDSAFFGFTPKEADKLDPQIRLCCTTAYEALEDAGIEPGADSEVVGVYLGASPNLDWQNHSSSGVKLFSDGFATMLMNDKDFLSTRISYLLNLTGPSVTLYTACSTSLVAVEMACQALLTGKCDTALVGAVSLSLPVQAGYFYEPGMIMSKDGHTRSFDQQATGSVFSDGIGMIVLKRLEDALEENNTIHAVIRGIGINNDGSEKIGYTAPGVKGQSEAIAMAHQLASIDADAISYIETHGSATPIGDQIEIEALNIAFSKTPNDFRCPVGSVKSNFGHLNTAAGMAGIIKTILMLKEKCIPPSLHCEQPIPVFSSPGNRFYVNTKLVPWKNNDNSLLRAGVSSFGIGGTNVHLVLEEAPAPVVEAETDKDHFLLTLSAKTAGALEQMTANLAQYLGADPAASLADISYTLNTGRNTSFDYRRSFVCNSIDNAVQQLLNPHERGVQTNTITASTGPLLFMLPGIGAQYRNMGANLYRQIPYFRDEVNRCLNILENAGFYQVREWLYPSAQEGNVTANENNFQLTQTALFVFEYSLSRLLIHWGLKPDYLVGYSLGELAAACLAGVFTLEQALHVLIKRGKLIDSLPAGMLLSVPLPAAEVKPLLRQGIYIAIDNGPTCIVTGNKSAIESFTETLKEKRLLSFIIPSSKAIHSPLVAPVLDEFKNYLDTLTLQEPGIPFLSNVTGDWISAADATSSLYWCRHLSQTVLFGDDLQKVAAISQAVVVEVGPGNDLSVLLQRLLPQDRKAKVISTVRNATGKKHDSDFLLQKIGQLSTLGYTINWKHFYAGENRRKISLPTYPFENTYHTIKLTPRDESNGNGRGVNKDKDISKWFYVPSWKRTTVLKNEEGSVKNYLLVFDNDNTITNVCRLHTSDIITVTKGNSFQQPEPGTYIINPVNAGDYSLLFQHLAQRGITLSRLVHGWTLGKSTNDFLNIETIRQQQEDGFYSLMHSIRELGKTTGLSDALTITVVTDHLFEVTGQERVEPGKSPVLSLMKVIPQEYPGIRCKMIDLDEEGLAGGMRPGIVNDLLSQGTGEVIAWRGHYRWMQDFAPLALDATPAKVKGLRKNGTYFITGGLGNIGMSIARFLHEEYQANLILISRTSVPDPSTWQTYLNNEADGLLAKRIKGLQELQERGASFITIAADIADIEEMENAVEIAEKKFGTIHGVFHAAGIIRAADFQTIGEMNAENFETHCRPKIYGALTIYKIFSKRSCDFVLMTSSLSPLLGGIGLAAYAAANQFLDSLCGLLAAKGLPWISLNWADWKGWENEMTGIKISGEAVQLNITQTEGIETLRRILHYALQEGQVAISAGNLLKRLDNWVLFKNENPAAIKPVAGIATAANRPAVSNEYVAPVNDIEKKLVTLWEEITGFSGIGVEDDFSELGGDSLKAVIMLSRARKILDTIIPLGEFFNNRTVRALEQLSRQKEKKAFQPIPTVSEKDHYSLSSEQRRLFFLREFDESGTGYNETHVDIIEGPLNINRMEDAFRKIIDRHEVYRTAIIMTENGPVQQVKSHVDFQVNLFESTEEELPELIRNFSLPYDFLNPPFLRVGIVKLGTNRHALILDRHHIVSDGISTEILYHDLIELYEGRELNTLTIQYKDYAEWQEHEKQTQRLKTQALYWKKLFASSIPLLNLPADYARPMVSNFEGGVINFTLDKELTKAIRNTCAQHNLTVHNLLLSVFNIFLSKLSGQDDIVVGTPVAARRHPDLDPIIGIFVNTLPLRNFPQKGKPVSEFFQEVKEHVIASLENQEYPYEDMLEQLSIDKDPSRNPLFDVMFVYQNLDVKHMNFQTIKRTPYPYSANKSKMDLNLVCWDNETTLDCNLEYSASIFTHATAQRFATYFNNILLGVIEKPEQLIGEIDYLPASEKHQLLYDFNSLNADEFSGDVLQQMVERQVQQTPDAIAIVDNERTITYRELNHLSNQLAHRLRKMSVRPDDLVALFTGRSAQMVIGMLGILKAGGAYLPIDVNLPSSRIEYIITDSCIRLLLCDNSTLEAANELPSQFTVFNADEATLAEEDDTDLPLVNKPSDLVYAIYTSGSTGNPKGILLEHKNAVNLVQHCIHHAELDYKKVLQFSTVSFDVSFSEIFYTLCSGGTLHLIDEATRKNITGMLELIGKHQISTVFLPMSLLHVLFSDPAYAEAVPDCIKHIQTAGEQVTVSEGLRKYLQRNKVYLHNHYGPAETHVVTTLALSPEEEIPTLPSIGYPIINTPVYIVDSENRLVPIGVTGELCAGGAQVGRGYLGKEELTKEKFLQNPFKENDRIYKTGDLAKWRPDGSIEFLGRADRQVKIRGYRVELGEVEQALVALDGIKQAVVDLHQHTTGDKYLCAYLVTDTQADHPAIRRSLTEKLPDYMIPSQFFFLDSIPVTPHGKIDRSALPAQDAMVMKVLDKPANEVEQSLLRTWSQLLHRDEEAIGTTDNFFEAGGHSLKAMQLLMRIQNEFKVRISLPDFFKKPTIQSLAESIRQRPGTIWNGIVPTQEKEFYPATSAQKRLYFLWRLNPKGIEYNITSVYRVEGGLDIKQLNKAISELINRHEILRTRFEVKGNDIVQKVAPALPFAVELINTNAAEPVHEYMRAFIRPFDLHTPQLFRIGVIQKNENSCVLLIDFHHIIWDDVSFGIFASELKSLYENAKLSVPALQFRDYACWQQTEEFSQWMVRQEQYWLKEFTQHLPPVTLPLDHARQKVRNYEGDAVDHLFDDETVALLKKYLAKEGATTYAFLLTVFNIVLSKLTNQYDITIGSPVSGRREAVLASMPGMFVNTIALRNFPKPNQPFTTFLYEVMHRMQQAFDNQEYPLEQLVNKLKIQSKPGHNPLFDIMIEFNYEQENNLQLNKLTITPLPGNRLVSKFDLTLLGHECNGELRLEMRYASKLFSQETILRFMQSVVAITEQVLANHEILLSEINLAAVAVC
ncbi:amino acid adenylation domain-containing protein [Niastella sp. OAS944]|uniref:amino acid adenylation domain-containing protein n=1 Tax=Niastella sp. OAS944 TaxID=2664089 RepID=UPI00348AC3BA|nr:amino acid adenylation domain-containing protein [Chitinophagaceae bacterium OAS944]